MTYQIFATHQFQKDVKYYKKKKKYFKIDDDIEEVISRLKQGKLIGEEISNLGLAESNHLIRLESLIQALMLENRTVSD